MEARTADVYTGPCFANGEIDINGKEAVFGWKINNGAWKGVNVAGLGVVGVVKSKYTLGSVNRPENPATAVLIVDSRATAEQREALVAFAKSQTPDLLKNVVLVKSAPIDLVVQGGNMHGGAARLTAGSAAGSSTGSSSRCSSTSATGSRSGVRRVTDRRLVVRRRTVRVGEPCAPPLINLSVLPSSAAIGFSFPVTR